MKKIKTETDNPDTIDQTISWMVKGGMDKQMIIAAIADIFELTPLESSYTNDAINACYLLRECTEQRVVRYEAPSGIIHGILRRSHGGNGKTLCGRVGDGWECKGYDVEITCRQCLSRNI